MPRIFFMLVVVSLCSQLPRTVGEIIEPFSGETTIIIEDSNITSTAEIPITVESFSSSSEVSMLQRFERDFNERCPFMKSHDLPMEIALNVGGFTVPLTVTAQVILHRIIDIDDLAQTMSIFMEIALSWPCLCSSLDMPYVDFPDQNKIVLVGNASEMWHPKLIHVNGAYDAYPFNKMTTLVEVKPFASTAHLTYAGTLVSSCDDFSFTHFPFDLLECSIDLDIAAATYLYHFDNAYVSLSPSTDLLGDTDIWTLVADPTASIKLVPRAVDKGETKTSRASFKLSLKRKANYYASGIFLPVITLFLLNVFGLFIEPSATDRPSFCMTVVLSFAVILSLVFTILPKTSEDVYLVDLIVTKLIIAVLITMYTLVATCLAEMEWAVKTHSIFGSKHIKISTIRLIDIAVGLASILCVVIAYGVYMDEMMAE